MKFSSEVLSKIDVAYETKRKEQLPRCIEHNVEFFTYGAVVVDSHVVCNVTELPRLIKQLQILSDAVTEATGVDFGWEY